MGIKIILMKNKKEKLSKKVFFLALSCFSLLFFVKNVEASGNESIMFLHHSTGGNLYTTGGVSAWFSNYNQNNGTSYQITQRSYPTTPYPWNNYPYDYWNLWINGACDSSDPDIECMNTLTQNYEVIIFKHCYPGAAVLADTGSPSVSSSVKSLENYKLQYRALRSMLDSYPNNKFIIWTLSPLHRLATTEANAQRAKEFVDWVKEDFLTEDSQPHENIYIFDWWGYVAGLDNYLKYEYEISHTGSDSHPNNQANIDVGPIFSQFIVDTIDESSDTTAPSAPSGLSVS
ncbi:MAG: hypothetical protein A2271_01340 [Candidatus Moranbacteria bacterium RIFOXYA12_FULL_35_19]|nr:MAG: hypothetical protein UR78_C0007G0031 [Candidatus Moranbacteria bacterium GW2011_GWF2_35_39]OGI32665.1 MAG: hypothetical protein A2489_00370 [Candidatus Moranbacteria bacterium RIFOXYC12_FULL_36_13]OGI35620.1 MAG: hypothetical protein A2271_01340 [Candidatus Moranbacteria bacterium RIFOXYA12_FULL_35_19]